LRTTSDEVTSGTFGSGAADYEEAGSVTGTPGVPDMRLELVPLPVSDVDRAKAFYERAGFGNVHDTQVNETMRVVQLTPPGSSCAIVFGTGMGPITDMVPGSVKGLHLVVEDMTATRAALSERGIELSGVDDMGGVLYSYFSDPDGNMWAIQQWPAGYQA
jgi:catechol 2,3-dioxygenase-like lactoylglutathione lyase family enzyme